MVLFVVSFLRQAVSFTVQPPVHLLTSSAGFLCQDYTPQLIQHGLGGCCIFAGAKRSFENVSVCKEVLLLAFMPVSRTAKRTIEVYAYARSSLSSLKFHES
jgi:hypothetical protein